MLHELHSHSEEKSVLTSIGILAMYLIISSENLSARRWPFSTNLNFPVVLLIERQVCLQTLQIMKLSYLVFVCEAYL